jgi:hypothetical protein
MRKVTLRHRIKNKPLASRVGECSKPGGRPSKSGPPQVWQHLGPLLSDYIFLCDFVSNESFRRELLRVLDRGEATHRLLRAIHYGNITATRGRRREELSAISGSLTF